MAVITARRPDVCAACGGPIRAGERIDWDPRARVACHAGCAGAAGGTDWSKPRPAAAGPARPTAAAAAPAAKAPAAARQPRPLPPEAPVVVHLRGLRPEDAPAPGSELRDPATGRAMRAVYAIPVWVAADGEWVVCVGARPADEGQDPGGA